MVSVAAGTEERSIPAASPLLLRGAATAGAEAAAHRGAGARGGGTELRSERGKCCLMLVFQLQWRAFSSPGAAAADGSLFDHECPGNEHPEGDNSDDCGGLRF
jgi:hypothetical protein